MMPAFTKDLCAKLGFLYQEYRKDIPGVCEAVKYDC